MSRSLRRPRVLVGDHVQVERAGIEAEREEVERFAAEAERLAGLECGEREAMARSRKADRPDAAVRRGGRK